MTTQATHEIRYRGELLDHMTEAQARSFVKKKGDDSGRDHANEFEIARRRPIELHVRGNLVDTFDDHDAAEHALIRRVMEGPVDVATAEARKGIELSERAVRAFLKSHDHGFVIVDATPATAQTSK